MASLTEIFTGISNLTTAVSKVAQTIQNVQGAQSRSALSAATVVKGSPGRLCTINVTTAGSAPGTAYDAIATGVTTNPIFVIPAAAGSYPVNLQTNAGIVVVPGPGQTLTVSFS